MGQRPQHCAVCPLRDASFACIVLTWGASGRPGALQSCGRVHVGSCVSASVPFDSFTTAHCTPVLQQAPFSGGRRQRAPTAPSHQSTVRVSLLVLFSQWLLPQPIAAKQVVYLQAARMRAFGSKGCTHRTQATGANGWCRPHLPPSATRTALRPSPSARTPGRQSVEQSRWSISVRSAAVEAPSTSQPASTTAAVSQADESTLALRSRLQLHNTMSRRKETFTARPQHPDYIQMYVCGVTVYDYSHIGARAHTHTRRCTGTHSHIAQAPVQGKKHGRLGRERIELKQDT